MQFNENPLTYRDAVNYLRSYESRYRISSQEFFDALRKGEEKVEIDADSLYEWRGYFEFASVMGKKFEAALAETPMDEGLPFALVGDDLESDESLSLCAAANNNLALAA